MRLKTSEKRYYGLFDYNPEHIYEIGDIVIYDELAYRVSLRYGKRRLRYHPAKQPPAF